LEKVLQFETYLNEKILDFSNSLGYTSRYNSIDITKKNLQSVIEEGISNLNDREKLEIKNVERFTQSFCEDVLESFEEYFENMIKNSEIHESMNSIPFYQKDSKSQRFCGFCVIKKVYIKIFHFFINLLIESNDIVFIETNKKLIKKYFSKFKDLIKTLNFIYLST